MVVHWRRGEAGIVGGESSDRRAPAAVPPIEQVPPSPSAPRSSSAVRILRDREELDDALRRAAGYERQLLERLSRLASHYNK